MEGSLQNASLVERKQFHRRQKWAGHMTIFRLLTLPIVLLVFSGLLYGQELRRSGFLGVTAVPIPDETRKQLDPSETGIMVKSVVQGGSAKDADIRADDVITQVNNHRVIDVTDFVQTVKT